MGFGPVQWKKAGWVRRSALGRQRSRLGLALASLGQRELTCSLLLLDAAGGDGDGSRGALHGLGPVGVADSGSTRVGALGPGNEELRRWHCLKKKARPCAAAVIYGRKTGRRHS